MQKTTPQGSVTKQTTKGKVPTEMLSNTLRSDWSSLKTTVKRKFTKFSDSDVEKIKGSLEQFSRVLKEKYGYAEETCIKMIDEFINESKLH